MIVLYVACLYALPARIRALPRDDPAHIMGRSALVATSSVACMGAVLAVARDAIAVCPSAAGVLGSPNAELTVHGLRWLGVRFSGVGLALGRPLLLISLLYLGPLATTALLAQKYTTHRVAFTNVGWAEVPLKEQRSFAAALVAVLRERVESEVRKGAHISQLLAPSRGGSCVCVRGGGGGVSVLRSRTSAIVGEQFTT